MSTLSLGPAASPYSGSILPRKAGSGDAADGAVCCLQWFEVRFCGSHPRSQISRIRRSTENIMHVFVSYGYGEPDRWIEELVYPLLTAIGCTVADGKAAFGTRLEAEIRTRILGSDALIGFTTRRERIGNAWTTHRWVLEELALAFNSQIPTIEVRENGIDGQKGMLGAIQQIEYNDAHRDSCLVQLATAVSQIRTSLMKTILKLGPSSVVRQLRMIQSRPGFRSYYQIMRQNVESQAREAKVWPIAGGVCMAVDGLRNGDLIRACIEYGGGCWRSDYETVDAFRIDLQKEK